MYNTVIDCDIHIIISMQQRGGRTPPLMRATSFDRTESKIKTLLLVVVKNTVQETSGRHSS